MYKRQNIEDSLIEQVGILADNLPSTVVADLEESTTASEWLALKFLILLVERVSIVIFAIPVTLLLLVVIITVRTFKDLFIWMGWGLALGGVITLLLPVDVLPIAVVQLITNPAQAEVWITVAIALNQAFGQSILIQGGAVVVAGLTSLIVATLITTPEDQLLIANENLRASPAQSR
ncbi:MAG: hypothetical protein GYB68_19950 [Chloroflexi bacterium]|nr:hypothetical protein [Chloroflexota bacterium]